MQVLYSIRSERLLVEQLDYNLLFLWFVGLRADEPVSTTFIKGQRVELGPIFVASSDHEMRYQWLKDGVVLAGENQPTLLIDSFEFTAGLPSG